MAEQPALDAHRNGLAVAHEAPGRDQVEQDVIVVAGVEGHALLGAGLDDAPHHVQRAVAAEGRDLDRHHVLQRGEAAPEGGSEHDTAHRRLQVEADEGDALGEPGAVLQPLVLARAGEGGEAHHARVIAEAEGCVRLGQRLLRPSDQAGDPHQRPVGPGVGGLGGELQHRLIEPRLPDRELRGVNADGKPACAGVDVVAGECALPLRVQPALGVERERMRRDHDALGERRPHRRRHVAPGEAHDAAGAENTPSLTSYWVGLVRLGMSRATQSATQSIIRPNGTRG